jgi:hypothetical protein
LRIRLRTFDFFQRHGNFIQLSVNYLFTEGLDPPEFRLTKTPAVLQLGCTPGTAVGEVAAQSQRSFRVTSVSQTPSREDEVHPHIQILFRFNLNIILKCDFRIFRWLILSRFSSKMFRQFSSPHMTHFRLFGFIVSCSKYFFEQDTITLRYFTPYSVSPSQQVNLQSPVTYKT